MMVPKLVNRARGNTAFAIGAMYTQKYIYCPRPPTSSFGRWPSALLDYSNKCWPIPRRGRQVQRTAETSNVAHEKKQWPRVAAPTQALVIHSDVVSRYAARDNMQATRLSLHKVCIAICVHGDLVVYPEHWVICILHAQAASPLG
jgi:hypothetical protein